MVLSGPRSRAGALLIITLSLIAVVLCAPEESPKRAPSGFLGVRGKKDSAFSNEEAYGGKRAPAMGFQGVRGKKDNEDLGYDKRGPSMGFHGMRGKKDPDSQQQLLQDFLDKRAPMGFMGMRGKKDPTDFDYFDKRAPPLGFQGMRGKKAQWEEDPDVLMGPPSVGFHGIGGKKEREGLGLMQLLGKDVDLVGDDYPQVLSDEDIWGDEEEVLGNSEDLNKRVPASGFFGMRGKKVPNAGFFGMRGKKGPSVGFFAMRGKKVPSTGFMGMRGKKESEGSVERTEDLDTLLQYLGAAYQQGRDKRNGERTPGSKKAPSGFLGTRGKKAWPTQQVVVSSQETEPEAHTSQLSDSE
ncbi:hypothetical protein B7P43_G05492 [Cryptotermes secundus]|uniref:Tachykinins n=1 Tax=Cryptotermes secundus TaxID=105785 RepID=A0A2J7R1M3_9NEOP|nr:tachykinins [Cryptotermes secundus]XP_023706647.1 tachykinins [Cryptotermes secundus]PNF34728.1 hypothetical protein B7P43_G05492 [Cryptotermes secundus]